MTKLEDLIELQIQIELDKMFIASYHPNEELTAMYSGHFYQERQRQLDEFKEKSTNDTTDN